MEAYHVKDEITDITQALKGARQGKGLSQRALGARVGLPQAHISKIENGATDIRLSTLIELARALDLEVELIPRSVTAHLRTILLAADQDTSNAPRPLYTLDEDEADG